MATPCYHETKTKTQPASKGDSIVYPTPADTTRQTLSSSIFVAQNSVLSSQTKNCSVGSRTNASTKQKQGTPLAIFEEIEKTPQPKSTFRKENEKKDDRGKSRSLNWTDRRKDKPRSAPANENILSTQSPSQPNSRLLQERRKTL